MLVAMKPLVGRKGSPNPFPPASKTQIMRTLSVHRDFKKVAQITPEVVEVSLSNENSGPKPERKLSLERGMSLDPRGPGGR